VEKLGYEPQLFGSKGGRGLAAGKSWNADLVDKIMRRCSGAVILGFPIWTWTGDDQRTSLVSEYCHYEGAIAKVYGLPILALLEEGAKERVIFNRSGNSNETTIMPLHAGKDWINDTAFQDSFRTWKNDVEKRYDLFFGYSSQWASTATLVKRGLKKLGVKVFDWSADFVTGPSILTLLEEATSKCSTGVFLLTGDDEQLKDNSEKEMVPRDNVVFEVGYFARAKGNGRILIIHEEHAKIPADLKEVTYVPLSSRSELGLSATQKIEKFIDECL
jgi:predicted nucleotide-binding protein